MQRLPFEFQFLIGRLATLPPCLYQLQSLHISIPYRQARNLHHHQTTHTSTHQFQFLIGRLATCLFPFALFNLCTFQFLIGRLATYKQHPFPLQHIHISIPYRQARNPIQYLPLPPPTTISIPYRQARNQNFLSNSIPRIYIFQFLIGRLATSNFTDGSEK